MTFNNMKMSETNQTSETPRTDAAREATYKVEYQYVGAEDEAWIWAEKLEKELNELKRSIGHA